MIEYTEWRADSRDWKSNSSRMYNLILQHCPTDLEDKLNGMASSETIRLIGDALMLFKILHDICHKYDELRKGTMAHIE